MFSYAFGLWFTDSFVSFLCPIVSKIHTDNQSLAIYQQDFKNKIMKNVSAFVLSWSRATLSFIL